MKKIIAILAVFASISSASAADKTMNVGALIGYGTASNNGTSISGLTYGAELNYALNPSWSLGLYWAMTKKSDYAIAGDSFTYMPIMLQANYMVDGWKGFYVGPRVGITSGKYDTGISGFPSVSNSDFTLGAQAGYDADIAADWSVGIEANWNYIMNSTAKVSLFNFVVPIKFHF